MTAAHLLSFSLASLVLILAPGPSVLFIIGRALSYGRANAVASALGVSAGSFLLATTVAVGLGSVIAASSIVFLIVKIVGGLYMCYLGVQAFRRCGDLVDSAEAVAELTTQSGGRARSYGRAVRQGVLVGLTNPKTLVFFAAVLPQFVVPEAGSPRLQMVLFAVIFCAIAAVSDSVWGLAAGAARGWFARSPQRLRTVGGIGGVTMVGLGAGLVVAGGSG